MKIENKKFLIPPVFIAVVFIAIVGFTTNIQAQSFQILNSKVEQGSVLIIKISSQRMPPATQNPSISIFGKHYLPNKYGEVFIGIDKNIDPGIHIATLVEYGRGVQLNSEYQAVEILERNFTNRIRTPGSPRNSKELQKIEAAYKRGNRNEKYFKDKFVRPLDLIIIDKNRTIGEISEFGQFGGETHRGVDLITLDPKTGKHQRLVKAINPGRVVLIAKNFSLEGNMIIIDHGSCILSIYMHLSEFRIKEGEFVKKRGQVIGISGKSGGRKRKPIGPHLHFGLRLRDPDDPTKSTVVDPLVFIETMNQYLE